MDHSYRTVNGNVADSPPSTIEFRNGNMNGNGHYMTENAAPWEAPPPPINPIPARSPACRIAGCHTSRKMESVRNASPA